MLKYLRSINQISTLKYSLALILIVIPLYPKFPLFQIPGTYVAIRAEDFLLSIISVIWIWFLFKEGLKGFLQDKINIAIGLYLFAGLLSLISAIFLTNSVAVHLGMLHFARRVEYILPFLIAVSAIKAGVRPKYLVETIFIVTFFVFLYGLGQVHLGWPVISTQNEEYAKGVALRWIPGARLHSTFAGHYDLAAYLVLVFPFAYAYFFRLNTLIKKLLLFGFIIMPMYWLFLKTESRISFLAYLISVCFTLIVMRKKLYILPFLVVSVIGVFALSDLGTRYMRLFNAYKYKLVQIDNIFIPKVEAAEEPKFIAQAGPTPVEDRSTSIRLNVEWPRAFRAFYKNPLLGTGYSSLGLATDSDYIRLLGEVGLVGFLAFFLLISRISEKIFGFLKTSKVIAVKNVYVAGFAGALLGMMVNAAFIDIFEASKVAIVFWTMAGIAVGIILKDEKLKSR